MKYTGRVQTEREVGTYPILSFRLPSKKTPERPKKYCDAMI